MKSETEKTKIEVAKNLLKKGMAKEEVAEITKLEMEEIVKLL